jgi:hypothetical protein
LGLGRLGVVVDEVAAVHGWVLRHLGWLGTEVMGWGIIDASIKR